MDLRTLARGILPPLVLDLYRRRRYGYVWQGVYRHYRDVPRIGDGYAGGTWVQRLRAETSLVLEDARGDRTVPTEVTEEYQLLPLLVSLVCSTEGKVRVLDF